MENLHPQVKDYQEIQILKQKRLTQSNQDALSQILLGYNKEFMGNDTKKIANQVKKDISVLFTN